MIDNVYRQNPESAELKLCIFAECEGIPFLTVLQFYENFVLRLSRIISKNDGYKDNIII